MSIQNEERVEELLHDAHMKGFGKAVIESATMLMKRDTEYYTAWELAYNTHNNEYEIHRRGHTGQGAAGTDDRERGSSDPQLPSS